MGGACGGDGGWGKEGESISGCKCVPAAGKHKRGGKDQFARKGKRSMLTMTL